MEPTRQRTKLIRNPIYNLNRKQRRLAALGMALGIIVILMSWYLIWGIPRVVPKSIQKAVDFSIYYPGTMVPGYVLDTHSFRIADSSVVIFAVTHGKNKNIIFSEQDQPLGSDIDKFITAYLPLNSDVKLPLGQAKVGAVGSAPNIRTVVSFPIRNGPWLIVTAPSDVSHDDLVKLLASLTK